MKRIKKGDVVIVTAGKDKGRRGTVLKIFDNEKLIVEGVNTVKKHQKANPYAGAPGGILEREAPLHLSNVMLLNPHTDKGDRVGFRLLDDGRKVRFFKSNNEVVDV